MTSSGNYVLVTHLSGLLGGLCMVSIHINNCSLIDLLVCESSPLLEPP